ncbi:glycosyltransferase [Chryseosolibacter indicus]|uniref:Glycosyl transferase n=1 Tax=Chryseosolibacter indicus TaxID=2782351 RepID=A0ABS5VVN1_9BACT|nr:glycosyltransferase [Chryseosolibacter indicus]MBT1705492.1 glycosyl transferase [Chryseosolibacter indicus]
MNKKVLIVTYYWPPSAGSGVQRWLKFVKYLPQFGWQPYVFTPKNPSFNLKDESLLRDVPKEAEVIHFPIWEPYEAFFKLGALFGNKKKEKANSIININNDSLFNKVSTWIRGNMLIPDPRRFWIKPSVKFLESFLREKKIDIIITTGPPHSMHLIGYELKKRNPALKWIADFRDPWSEWGLLDSLRVTSLARSLHRKMEKKVLTLADVITTITPFYVSHFEKLAKRKVQLLTNGFDEDDFKGLKHEVKDNFTICHVGVINEKCNPRPLMNVIFKLIKENKDFASKVRIDFVGEVHSDFKSFVEQNKTLSSVTSFVPSIPHKELVRVYASSSLLLLILSGYKNAEGYMPGKLFEYLATGLPVLGVGPEHGNAADLLKTTSAGVMVDETSISEIENYIIKTFIAWGSNGHNIDKPVDNQYSRKNLTSQLSKILELKSIK